jgi:hypothetical protein
MEEGVAAFLADVDESIIVFLFQAWQFLRSRVFVPMFIHPNVEGKEVVYYNL